MASDGKDLTLPASNVFNNPTDHSNSDEMVIKLIGRRLCINGFIYIKSHIDNNNEMHWKCRRCHLEGCRAKAVTSNPSLNKEIILFKHLDGLRHNHSFSIEEVEKAKITAEYEEAEKCELVPVDQICSQSETHSDNESEVVSSSETEEKMEENTLVTESESELSIQSTVSTGTDGVEDVSSPITPFKITAHGRLYLGGFLYTRSYSYGSGLSKTHWQCPRYKTGECPALAITSNPDLNQDLIVYKNPTESGHTHPPITLANVDEAEEAAAIYLQTNNTESNITAQTDVKTFSAYVQSSTNYITNSVGSEEVENISDCSRQKSSDTDNGASGRAESRIRKGKPRIIGKRLYIDGYIYSPRDYRGTKIKWCCMRRQRSNACQAVARTSNYRLNGNLIVHKGPETSKHNHLPTISEVRKAEKVSSLSKINGELLRRSRRTKTPTEARSQELVSRKYYQIQRTGLLKNDQMYREFLVKFSENPIFDRQSVIKALKIIYSSYSGCYSAYATILENRDKIKRDLETLQNNPDATFAGLNNVNCSTSQDDKIEESSSGEQLAENDDLSDLKSKKSEVDQDEDASKNTIEKESDQTVMDICSQTNEGLAPTTESSKSQESLPLHQDIRDETCPPVSVAVAKPTPRSSELPTLNQEELKVKQEIVLIDLTNDDEVKLEQECVTDTPIVEQPNQTQQIVDTQGNPPTVAQNFDSLRGMGAFRHPQQNHQFQYGMHPNLVHPFYNPAMCHPFMNFNVENSNFNAPVNNVQMPWPFNPPNMMNNLAVSPEELFAQFQCQQYPN